jgi:cell division protein FtsQ
MKLRIFIYSVLVCIMAVLFLWGEWYVHLPTTLPIEHVNVQGSYKYVKPQLLQQAVMPYLTKGFFNVNVAGAQNALAKMAPVKTATVRRVFPHTVVIKVTERTVMARTPGDLLIGPKGHIFAPQRTDQMAGLPVFKGQEDVLTLQHMLAMYATLTPLFAAQKLTITSLNLDAMGVWRVGLNHQFNMNLGPVKPVVHLKRFLAMYSAILKTKLGFVPNYANLNYKNGFAVGWAKQKAMAKPA